MRAELRGLRRAHRSTRSRSRWAPLLGLASARTPTALLVLVVPARARRAGASAPTGSARRCSAAGAGCWPRCSSAPARRSCSTPRAGTWTRRSSRWWSGRAVFEAERGAGRVALAARPARARRPPAAGGVGARRALCVAVGWRRRGRRATERPARRARVVAAAAGLGPDRPARHRRPAALVPRDHRARRRPRPRARRRRTCRARSSPSSAPPCARRSPLLALVGAVLAWWRSRLARAARAARAVRGRRRSRSSAPACSGSRSSRAT